MRYLVPLFERIDAAVATSNPFTVDVWLSVIVIVLLALLAFEGAIRIFRRQVEQPLVDAARRDAALQPFMRPPATLSGCATKFLGSTKDDEVVIAADDRRRHLANIAQFPGRQVGR